MARRVWKDIHEAAAYYGSLDKAIEELNKACKEYQKKHKSR